MCIRDSVKSASPDIIALNKHNFVIPTGAPACLRGTIPVSYTHLEPLPDRLVAKNRECELRKSINKQGFRVQCVPDGKINRYGNVKRMLNLQASTLSPLTSTTLSFQPERQRACGAPSRPHFIDAPQLGPLIWSRTELSLIHIYCQ